MIQNEVSVSRVQCRLIWSVRWHVVQEADTVHFRLVACPRGRSLVLPLAWVPDLLRGHFTSGVGICGFFDVCNFWYKLLLLWCMMHDVVHNHIDHHQHHQIDHHKLLHNLLLNINTLTIINFTTTTLIIINFTTSTLWSLSTSTITKFITRKLFQIRWDPIWNRSYKRFMCLSLSGYNHLDDIQSSQSKKCSITDHWYHKVHKVHIFIRSWEPPFHHIIICTNKFKRSQVHFLHKIEIKVTFTILLGRSFLRNRTTFERPVKD